MLLKDTEVTHTMTFQTLMTEPLCVAVGTVHTIRLHWEPSGHSRGKKRCPADQCIYNEASV
ncbi:unnamed protein product [Staurois parvus]|uniref:Uncharacterized protein n=1 Tax=Staurois parvus TaxID=386267 RepID=A0ABN9CKA8_9NEOB|nr:unnamed protein product [Staurois parvus]